MERQVALRWRAISFYQFSSRKHGSPHALIFPTSQRGTKRLDYFRSKFFWEGDSEKQKYRVTKWSMVYGPKDQGGLGIQDLKAKNDALLS